jgi:hypothetical protein
MDPDFRRDDGAFDIYNQRVKEGICTFDGGVGLLLLKRKKARSNIFGAGP